MRLDKYLVTNKLVSSRNEALKLIKAGFVCVDNAIEDTPHTEIIYQNVKILQGLQYVSRAGEKLAYAIAEFKIDLKQRIVLDLGTSTGGFADVCLQNNAQRVYCVDVGTNQIHPKIKSDSRVISLENTNVKDLNTQIIPDTLDLVISDLSFISSRYMFECLEHLHLKHGCHIISLIKPQFELSKEIVSKHNAYITEPKLHMQAIQHVRSYAQQAGLKIMQVIESPIVGAKKHNKEFILWCIYE